MSPRWAGLLGPLMLLLSLAASPAGAGDVSIMPSLLEIDLEPGSDFTTVVQLVYTQDGVEDNDPVRILLDTENWDMDPEGKLSFAAGDSAGHTARPWIVFSPGEAEIRPGEILSVRLSVIVPEEAHPGEYRAALIAQPRMPYQPVQEGQKQLRFRFRLASIIYVAVPPLTRDLALDDLQVNEHQGQWRVRPAFYNPGTTHIRITDTFQILSVPDLINQKLAGTYDPNDPDAGVPEGLLVYVSEEAEAGVVLPGRRRTITHYLPTDLAPGRYRLRYIADAGNDLPLLEGETTFHIPSGNIGPITMAEDN
jgi:hypothetical protein